VPDDICCGQGEGAGRCHSARLYPGSNRIQERARSAAAGPSGRRESVGAAVGVAVFAHVSGAEAGDGAMP
jgi:hypothetical protein